MERERTERKAGEEERVLQLSLLLFLLLLQLVVVVELGAPSARNAPSAVQPLLLSTNDNKSHLLLLLDLECQNMTCECFVNIIDKCNCWQQWGKHVYKKGRCSLGNRSF